MVYYTTNTYHYPYAWSTTSSGTSSTSYTYKPSPIYTYKTWRSIPELKGLDRENVTEDMIEDLLKEDDN